MATSESLSEEKTEEQLTPDTTLSEAHPAVTQRDFAKAMLN